MKIHVGDLAPGESTTVGDVYSAGFLRALATRLRLHAFDMEGLEVLFTNAPDDVIESRRAAVRNTARGLRLAAAEIEDVIDG